MTDETVPAPVAQQTGCCSDHHHHHHDASSSLLPVTSGLPIANECCSTAGGCSTEAAAVDDGPPPDDATLIDALREVIDPELMINIVDLGLVYSINLTDRKAFVEMTNRAERYFKQPAPVKEPVLLVAA